MSLQNPSTLYSGGQGVFDPYKGLQLHANLLAKKQAKEDALDAYYKKSLNDLTPAGMRNKDVIGGWAQKADEWRNFAIKNKEYLLKPNLDNYRTVTEFNRQFKELQSEAEWSKQEAKDEQMLNEQRISGKWNPTEDDMEIANRKGLSIYDSNRLDAMGKQPEMVNFSFNVPEFDATYMGKYDKNIIGKEKMGKTYDDTKARNDKGSGQVFIPFTESYTPTQIKNMADKASVDVLSNKVAKKHFENLLYNSEWLDKANIALQSVYGKDAIVDNPSKAAAADQIMRRTAEGRAGEEVKTDWIYQVDKKFNNQIYFENKVRQPNRKELIGLVHAYKMADTETKQQQAYDNLESYRINQIKNGTKLPSFFENFGIDTKNTIKLNVSPTDLESFDVEIPVVDEDGKPMTDRNGKPLLTKSKAKDIFYNTKTEEYTPIVDGVMGNKFKKDGWLISYINGPANTAPKINMLSGTGVKSGQTKDVKKSSKSASVTDRPNLPKTNKTKISW